MTPSSSKLPEHPVKLEHLACGSSWDMYAIEWPPKVAFCTNCRIALKLVAHNPHTHRLTYSRITK